MPKLGLKEVLTYTCVMKTINLLPLVLALSCSNNAVNVRHSSMTEQGPKKSGKISDKGKEKVELAVNAEGQEESLNLDSSVNNEFCIFLKESFMADHFFWCKKSLNIIVHSFAVRRMKSCLNITAPLALRGKTGRDVAHMMMKDKGISNYAIKYSGMAIEGTATVWKDVEGKFPIRLGDCIIEYSSLLSTTTAAHECAHIVQWQHGGNLKKLGILSCGVLRSLPVGCLWLLGVGLKIGLDLFRGRRSNVGFLPAYLKFCTYAYLAHTLGCIGQIATEHEANAIALDWLETKGVGVQQAEKCLNYSTITYKIRAIGKALVLAVMSLVNYIL